MNDPRKRRIPGKLRRHNNRCRQGSLQLLPVLGIDKEGYLSGARRGQSANLRHNDRRVTLK